MKTKSVHLKSFLIVILTVFVSLLICVSCSDAAPAINSIQTSVVFEFNDEESAPDQRLSLFLQTDEINRVEKIHAEHVQSGLEWNVFDAKKISSKDNKKWAGYTKLVPAYGSTIPSGKYSVQYTDAADKVCESSFSISYQSDFIKKKASDFPEAIKDKYSLYTAVYSADGTLIAYERTKKKWTDIESVREDVPMANKIRKCYVINNGSVMILMPFENEKTKQMETNGEQ